jgi:hypothetical protein
MRPVPDRDERLPPIRPDYSHVPYPAIDQRAGNDPVSRPFQISPILHGVMGQGIPQRNTPAKLYGMQSMPEGAIKDQPGMPHSIRGNSRLAIQTQAGDVMREVTSLTNRSGYILDPFPAIRTPTVSHAITSPAFRWKKPVQTTPYQLV